MLPVCRRLLRSFVGRTLVTSSAATLLVPMNPGTAAAFKPTTHLWVGQQVLNDVVPDGRVTIAGREYVVPAPRVAALRAHPDAYRMGHIGPDAHPDLVVGQSLVHPGAPWDVDAWLRHVVSEAGGGTGKEVAYAYGFLGHAAGDMWAHSYVNLYAGSHFDLTRDGRDGELRHVALEGFIDQHVPALVDHTGAPIGAATKSFAGPDDFLRDVFVLSKPAAAQYNRKAVLAAHLLAMRQFGLTLEDLKRTIQEIAIPPSELEKRLRGAALEAGIAVNKHAGPLAQAKLGLKSAQEALEAHQRAVAAAREVIAVQARLAEEAGSAITTAQSLHGTLLDRRQRVADDIARLAGDVAKTPSHVANEICRGGNKIKKLLRWIIAPLVCEFVQAVNPTYTRLVDAHTAAVRTVVNLDTELRKAVDDIHASAARQTTALAAKAAAEQQLLVLEAHEGAGHLAEQAVAKSLDGVQKLEAEQTRLEGIARKANENLGTLTDLQTSLVTGAIALRMDKWRGDVHRAISAYEGANTDVMRGLMGPDDAMRPLQLWTICWGPVFATVPAEVSDAACSVIGAVTQGLAMLQETRAEIADKAGLVGWVIDPSHKVEQLVLERVMPELLDIERDVLTRVAGKDVAALVQLLHTPVDADKLGQVFAVDRERQGLLLIPDAAVRVRADMGLQAGQAGPFNSATFAPAANAVTLAKLALLDAAGMRALLIDLGLTDTAALAGLREPYNALFGTLRSIDGGYQWLGGPAPPFPRRPGRRWWDDGPDAGERTYGLGTQDTPGTLVWLFADASRRKAVFERLFIGPIAPALESPQAFGLSEVLPADYPRGTSEAPFVSYRRERCWLVLSCDRWRP